MKFYNLIIIFLLGQPIGAQNKMLIGQLSKKLVIRENFDKNNNLINKQTFKVGEIIETNDYFEIKVITQLFDKNGKPIDKYNTIYRCKPDESSILVMVFPFSNSNSKKTKINSTSVNFKELYDMGNLEDVEMEISFDSGLLDFFGSKSILKLYDRKLQSNKTNKVIQSKLNIKAYALGIRIKKFEYKVIEKLSLEGLLLFQKFTEKDGSYFMITYKKSD